MRLYSKDSLQDALFEALSANPSAAAFVEKFATNLGRIIAKKPEHYRYMGPYWWPMKAVMIRLGIPGIDDFVDPDWINRINLPDDYVCVAAWAMAESRVGGMELPTNIVQIEDENGESTEFTIVDGFLEAKVKSAII